MQNQKNRAAKPPSIEEIAKGIIDNVLKIQTACQYWQEVEKAIADIQRSARTLLITQHGQEPAWVNDLAEFVTSIEKGVEIKEHDLTKHLLVLDVAAAKIRNALRLEAAVNKAERDLGINKQPGESHFPLTPDFIPPCGGGLSLVEGRGGALEGNDEREVANG